MTRRDQVTEKAHVEVPSDPRERNAWIKYQLALNNCTFADIAHEGGVSRTVVRRALVMKYPKWEAVIAAKIGISPAQIWPERYSQEQEVPASTPEKTINLAVVVEGGIVQGLFTDTPKHFSGVNVVVVDYDTNILEVGDDSLGLVPQESGSLATAHIQQSYIDTAGIDLARVADFASGKAYGCNQEHLAICGKNPCEGCEDCNTDGERCVNEDKCLAWQRYNQ